MGLTRKPAWSGEYLPFGAVGMTVAPPSLLRKRGWRGMGDLYKMDPSTGNVIDCDSWSNIFQGVCWDPTVPAVVPVAPAAASTGGTTSTGGVVAAVPAAAAGCTSSLFSGICDSTVYIAGAGLAVVALFALMVSGLGGGRR